MTTLTATDARKGLFDLLRGANERHEIYHIRHRQGDAVLMSEGYYSVRLSYQDRIVYAIHDDELVVLVLRARTQALIISPASGARSAQRTLR